jgi:uncharacterized protein YoxC
MVGIACLTKRDRRMADVTREEFEARVGVLEREVDGEKMVTRHILDQTRRNGDDLAAMRTRLDRVETRLDGVEARLTGVEQKVVGLTHSVDGLKRDMPKIVGDVMREVLDERDRKP